MSDFQVLVAWCGVVAITIVVAVTWLFWYTHGGREKW